MVDTVGELDTQNQKKKKKFIYTGIAPHTGHCPTFKNVYSRCRKKILLVFKDA